MAQGSKTIFSRIIDGEIPCHRVYEDQDVIAFLDVMPLSLGHTLVVPKEPAETLDQLSDKASMAVGKVLPRICRAVMRATGAKAYHILQNNGPEAHQAVFHVHFHIIPKPSSEKGLGIDWPAQKLDSKVGSELAEKIRNEMS